MMMVIFDGRISLKFDFFQSETGIIIPRMANIGSIGKLVLAIPASNSADNGKMHPIRNMILLGKLPDLNVFMSPN